MNSINEYDNPIYKKGLTRTQNIDDKLKKTRMECLNNNCSIVGPKKDILLHLKGGPAKNLINCFIKYETDKCDYCGIQKSKTVQLDRAHCNKDRCDRTSLLEKSINSYFEDETKSIKIKDILKTFILYHKGIPIFILCKKCHIQYDKKSEF
jgi:uncharacterized protein YqkB